MNLYESHGDSMRPNACDFVPFLDEFFPLLNMFANEAASEGFSATISATFMIPTRVSILLTTQRTQKLNLSVYLLGLRIPQRKGELRFSHRLQTVLHGVSQKKNSIGYYRIETAACLRKT